jgi:PAS domain S-box-containing protein
MSQTRPKTPPQPEELFHLLMENVRDYAIFSTDIDGHVATWNTGAERILGYSEQEAVGQLCNVFFTPEDQERGEPEKERTTAAATGRAEDERWHMRKDGSRFYASGIMTALYDESGELRAYVKILRDFTERKRHEEEREALNLKLQRAITEAHHRIKNNLQVIASLVDVELQDKSDIVSGAALTRVGQHIRTMAAIHELLSEQIKAGAGTRGISLAALLQELLPMLQNTVGQRPLRFDLEEVWLPSKQGTALAILVNELVSNAVKHGQGAIDLTLTTQEREATLAVCDDGPGFPEGFEPGSAAHIGLELVETLSRLDLSGQVSYENLPQGGGRVRVTFPLPA